MLSEGVLAIWCCEQGGDKMKWNFLNTYLRVNILAELANMFEVILRAQSEINSIL